MNKKYLAIIIGVLVIILAIAAIIITNKPSDIGNSIVKNKAALKSQFGFKAVIIWKKLFLASGL